VSIVTPSPQNHIMFGPGTELNPSTEHFSNVKIEVIFRMNDGPLESPGPSTTIGPSDPPPPPPLWRPSL